MEKPIVDYNDGDLIKGLLDRLSMGVFWLILAISRMVILQTQSYLLTLGLMPKKKLIPGDEISVDEKLETKEGYTRLSRKRAEILETWESIIQSYKSRNLLLLMLPLKFKADWLLCLKG